MPAFDCGFDRSTQQLVDIVGPVSRSPTSSWVGRLIVATALNRVWETADRLIPFGKYCLSNPLGFSLVPRCQG